jgi:SAM-dependent methyltransferase
VSDDPTASLRAAYDRHADERDRHEPESWKQELRQAYLDLLRTERARTLLAIGAGPGKDSLFFQQQGLDVTAVDLSPTNAARPPTRRRPTQPDRITRTGPNGYGPSAGHSWCGAPDRTGVLCSKSPERAALRHPASRAPLAVTEP